MSSCLRTPVAKGPQATAFLFRASRSGKLTRSSAESAAVEESLFSTHREEVYDSDEEGLDLDLQGYICNCRSQIPLLP